MFNVLLLDTVVTFTAVFLFGGHVLRVHVAVFGDVLLVNCCLAFLTFVFILGGSLDTAFRVS